ncbi:hypothetical protein GN244_ATG03135 [Phytophthora infestans]|uniref:Uncharacterized protein n=1 Tax=Phytophthora infestans TaxID=4787 RepID=A0A833SQU4_PHYIN|nr:hypothetical protein GN244_ATG03135 [Phytophthora infestans]
MMLIRHCPALKVPDIFKTIYGLARFRRYYKPGLLSLILIHVNMTDGVLTQRFLSNDFPLQLFNIEMCVSNLRELLTDLDTRWPRGSCVVIEQSQLRSVSASLLRLMPSYLSLKGNPISTLLIPPEIFEIEGLTDFGTDIREPPRNVSQPSSTLTTIYMYDTDKAYFWPWVENLTQCQPILAGESLYCSELQPAQLILLRPRHHQNFQSN